MTSIRHNLESILLRSIAAFMRFLSRNASIRLGELLGDVVYRIGIRTDVTRDNLRRAFPEKSPEEIEDIVRNCYRHFGAVLSEFARLPLLRKQNVPNLVETDDRHVLDEALKAGKGGIVVSGHLGNWELMGASSSVLGLPVNYVVTDQQNPNVTVFMDQLRQSSGVKIIKRRDAIKGVLKAMKNNELVAILSDQDAHEAGAFVPFFGRLASTPRGAAMFSLRTGAPLIFVESYRQGMGRLKVIHEFISDKDLPLDRDDAIGELTHRFTARLEEAVRCHPEQWFWMHRRWKSSPAK
ncbi:hypothetical protein CEE37_04085 [candidate division LCP-89 bacterium B3_LCP]|uniref:Lipid A biosynthesis acyltransferase n=1 Tax=candidate division LCP-89 bacterium B3_LCP TaxID=2012998 RepID=A0A532V3G2_UNCL8|nr:MAG: hypothetical protein CEE37_04085 [candidate division LCP-89 bacterium B3_LCP]